MARRKTHPLSKFLIPGLLLLLVGIVIGYFASLYFLSQHDNQEALTTETQDTSDWSKYENSEYGFELQYPPGWQIDEGLYTEDIVNLSANNTSVASERPAFIGVNNLSDVEEDQYFLDSTIDYEIVDVNDQQFVVYLFTYQIGTTYVHTNELSDLFGQTLKDIASTVKPIE